MTVDIQEMRRELEELRAYKKRREAEDRKKARSSEHTRGNAERAFHAAARAAGYEWVVDFVEQNAWGPPSRYGHYNFGVSDDDAALILLRHTDKKLLLAADFACRGMSFPNSSEIAALWGAGAPSEDILPLLPP